MFPYKSNYIYRIGYVYHVDSFYLLIGFGCVVLSSIVIDYRRYPFLASLDDVLYIKYPHLKIDDVLSNIDSYPVRRSLYLLKSIAGKGFVKEGTGSSEDEVLAFYGLLMGAKALRDKKLLHRIAYAYAREAYRSLMKEPLETIIYVARRIGLEAELTRNPARIVVGSRRNVIIHNPRPITLPFKQYLKIVSKRLAKDPKYMLVNQILDNGLVYLDREVFTRILEEVIYNWIIEMGDKIEFDGKIEPYLSEYKKVLEEIKWFEKRMETGGGGEIKGFYEDALPLCMKVLIDRLRSGENLSHHERFTIAAFLARIGLKPDNILEFFKNSPDFNEKIARYQIEHIAGERGSRKQYMPYNCDTMKTLGICPIKEYCTGGKNPLAVYKKNVGKMRQTKAVDESDGYIT